MNQFNWINKKNTVHTILASNPRRSCDFVRLIPAAFQQLECKHIYFRKNQVTDTLLIFHSLVKHGFTLMDTFTEQQNMVQ